MPLPDNVATVQIMRYDIDALQRELAGIRGRVDSVRADLAQGIRERAAVEREILTAISEQTVLVRECLEQVRVSQEQQGRMLRELAEVKDGMMVVPAEAAQAR